LTLVLIFYQNLYQAAYEIIEPNDIEEKEIQKALCDQIDPMIEVLDDVIFKESRS